jgi:2-polyprenyl-3-methyl-5-hydroxy-6-metoxy-1,4-benzoquinol methylase
MIYSASVKKQFSDILPHTTHDEAARLEFVKSLRGHVAGKIMPGNYELFESRIEPAVIKQTGKPPQDRHEVRKIMTREPYYQFWSALQRRSQELMWDSAIDATERQLPELIETFRRVRSPGGKGKGSLQLNPDLEIPRYHTAADIHIQPGAYHTEHTKDDVAAGAVFETGIQAYGWGLNLGSVLLEYMKSAWPDFVPSRILDMGCTIGSSTLPWAEEFPAAEVHAIDVAAPILRYAHARAESIGVPVHFSQQNAEQTDFESGSFDMVISLILLHETSKKALPRILEESRRLLRPGGLMLHFEVPRGDTPMEQFMHDWESYNNNESFARFMTDIDLCEVAAKAGWPAEQVRLVTIAPDVAFGKKNYIRGDVIFNVLVGECG